MKEVMLLLTGLAIGYAIAKKNDKITELKTKLGETK